MRAAFFAPGEALVDAVTVAWLAIMKRRLSADSRRGAHSSAQAKSAGRDRMLHR